MVGVKSFTYTSLIGPEFSVEHNCLFLDPFLWLHLDVLSQTVECFFHIQ